VDGSATCRAGFFLRAGRALIFLALPILARGEPDVEDAAMLDDMGTEVDDLGGGILVAAALWPRRLAAAQRAAMAAIFSIICDVRHNARVSTCFLTRVSFSPQNWVPQNAVRDLVGTSQ